MACAEEQRESRLAALRARVAAAPTPPQLESALAEALLRTFPAGSRVAVRSSAVSEDGHGASFAGQFETFLHVPAEPGAVLAHVKRCWASLFQPHAVAYWRRLGAGAPVPAMAVVVQLMAAPVSSGVAFSLNPRTGDEEEVAVEACWGLGEAVVSGRLTPHEFIFNWTDGRVVSARTPSLTWKIVPLERADPATGDFTAERETDAAERASPALSSEQVARVAEAALGIAGFFGHPQDIEWGFSREGALLLLQARPVTAVNVSVPFRAVFGGFAPVCPLSIAMNAEGFERTISRFVPSVKPGSHSTFFTRFGVAYLAPGPLRAYWDRSEEEIAALSFGELHARHLAPLLEAQRACESLAALRETVRRRLDALSEPELCGALRTLLDNQRLVDTASFAAGRLTELAVSELEALLSPLRDLSRSALLRVDCIVGPVRESGNSSAARLAHVARRAVLTARESRPGLSAAAAASELCGDLDSVLARSAWDRADAARALLERWGASRQALVREFQDWLSEFFYLSLEDEDLSAPRFDEDSSVALAALRGHIHAHAAAIADAEGKGGGDGPGKDRSSAGERGAAAAEDADALSLAVAAAMQLEWGGGEVPPLRRGCESLADAIRGAADWARACVAIKEGLHACYTRNGHALRALLRRRVKLLPIAAAPVAWAWDRDAKRVVREHVADQSVWGLTDLDVLKSLADPDLTRNPDALRAAARALRRGGGVRVMFANWHAPPELRPGKAASRVAEVARGEPGDERFLRGQGCGGGVGEGPACVARTLSEASRVRGGEILVAESSNPSWTPLFSLLAGAVVERGGLLSHAAVVARECGVPCIVGVHAATRIVPDGARLRVDGADGTVAILPPQ